MSFSVVKITENIHGIDLFNHEGFDFAKSGTEKKKKTFQSFSLLIGHFAFLPWLTFNLPLTDVVIKFHRRVSVCQNKLDLIFIAVINFTSSFALKPNDKENVEKNSTIYNRYFKDN